MYNTNKNKSLDEIADFYGTDKRKLDHDYTQFYSSKFEPMRYTLQSILEIGIHKNQNIIDKINDALSLRTWREYFSNATVYGIDIDDFLYLNDEFRFKIFKADQSNREQMMTVFNNINQPIDVVIDDGGHKMHQQQVSLGVIFPYLKNNGVYVIEDLHTSYDFNKWYYDYNDDTSTLSILQEFNNTGKILSPRMSLGERLYLEQNIKSCEIFKSNSSEIAFITKK